MGGLQLSLAYTYSHSIDDSSSARDAIILDSQRLGEGRAPVPISTSAIYSIWDMCTICPSSRIQACRTRFLAGGSGRELSRCRVAPIQPRQRCLRRQRGRCQRSQLGLVAVLSRRGRRSTDRACPTLASQASDLTLQSSAFAAPRGLTFGDMPRNFLTNPNAPTSIWRCSSTSPSRRDGLRVPRRSFQRVQPH